MLLQVMKYPIDHDFLMRASVLMILLKYVDVSDYGDDDNGVQL